ncbi:MAG: hypothetical protein ACK4OG_11490, partial [Parvibaculum sp.]
MTAAEQGKAGRVPGRGRRAMLAARLLAGTAVAATMPIAVQAQETPRGLIDTLSGFGFPAEASAEPALAFAFAISIGIAFAGAIAAITGLRAAHAARRKALEREAS